MGKTHAVITPVLREFIQAQHVFFVGTAPLASGGHINISPKGLDSLRVLDESTVAYADLIGSGVETIAHIQENRRIVLMFCAFEGPPKIVRLHGQGRVVEPGDPEFESLRQQFPDYEALRSIIKVHCNRVSDSCGFGVPLYEFQSHRPQLEDWADRKSKQQLVEYVANKNATSIDGLPGARSTS